MVAGLIRFCAKALCITISEDTDKTEPFQYKADFFIILFS
jgi:hypothetical protein